MPPKVSRTTPPRAADAVPVPTGPGVLGRIAPIGFDDDAGIKILLYGRSGTGKTTLWGTFPKPILAVVCSGGNNPGELRSIDTPEHRRTVHQVALETAAELTTLVEYVRDSRKYATVVLDHATGLQDLILAGVLGLKEPPAAKYWGLATQQQYGQVTVQAKELLTPLLGLAANVVLIAQERTFGGREEGSEMIAPSVGAGLQPSLAGWLNSAVDYVGQTFIRGRTETTMMDVAGAQIPTTTRLKGVDYCLRTGPDPVYMTKFRQPKGQPLPDVIVDPDYDKVLGIVRAGLRR